MLENKNVTRIKFVQLFVVESEYFNGAFHFHSFASWSVTQWLNFKG